MPDLNSLTDEELDQLRVEVLVEQDRRRRLTDTPAQIEQLAARYEEDGGDKADLLAAVGDTEALAKE